MPIGIHPKSETNHPPNRPPIRPTIIFTIRPDPPPLTIRLASHPATRPISRYHKKNIASQILNSLCGITKFIPYSDTIPRLSPIKQKNRSHIGLRLNEQCNALLRNSALLDTSLLTCELTQVVDTCTTYHTILVNLDLVDMG